MKIGVDIDDVLVEFFESYLKFVEPLIGKKDINDWTKEYIWEWAEITRKEALDLAERFTLSEEFKKVKLIKGSKEAIAFLSKKHELFFITSRAEKLEEITFNFLKQNYSLDPQLFFSGNVYGLKKSKEIICLEKGITHMVEDSGLNALKCAKEGIVTFLLDKPWNKEVFHEKILRVNNWEEITEKINLMERKNEN